MVYKIKDQRNSTHDILLVFDETLTLDSIGIEGVIVIILLILIYIGFVIWSIAKDKQKEVYAPNVENKIKEGFQIKPETIKRIDLDYTNETIDITSVTSEDIRHYSNMVNTEEGTPNNSGNKVIRFDTSSKKTEGDEVNLRANDRTSQMNLDISEIKGADRTVNLPPPMSDESIFRSTKRESKKRGPPTTIIKKRETVSTKFWRLMMQRHVVLSTKHRMSRISPRWKRIGLLYFLLLLDLFLATISFIDLSITNSPISAVFFDSSIAWFCFALISWLSSVSKDKLKDSLSTEEFQNALYAIESESKLKTIFTHFIIFIFAILSYIQVGLFISTYLDQAVSWIISGLIIFLIQVIIIEMVWTLFISFLYIRAYQSKLFKKLYKLLNLCRFWRI